MKRNTGQWPCLHDRLCLCNGQRIHKSFVALVSSQTELLQQLPQDVARTIPQQHWLESCLQSGACLCCCQLPCCTPLILSRELCSKRSLLTSISL